MTRKRAIPLTCVACHKIPKFCRCGPNPRPICPVCQRPQDEGRHFTVENPEVDCDGINPVTGEVLT